jgi:hypothetical protein
MRLSRAVLWAAVLFIGADAWRAFPDEPDARAHAVCAPVHWLLAAASAVSSAMDDRGRLGPVRPPWHDEAHRSCLRVAERVFRSAASV